MTLLLTNDISNRMLETADAIPVLTDAFEQLAQNRAVFQPRTDVVSPITRNSESYEWENEPEWYTWGSLLGAISDPPRLAFRFKSDILSWQRDENGTLVENKYNVEPGKFMGVVLLIDTANGELLAILNDGEIQHVRVGANAGIACDLFAREDASTVGMLGSGGMARTYLDAFCAVREINEVTVYSPTEENRTAYAEEMGKKHAIDITPVDEPAAAMKDVDIGATCTATRDPVYYERWLSEGVFVVNSVPTELSKETYEAADRIFTADNRPFCRHVIGSEDDDRMYKQRQYEWFETRDYELIGDVLIDKNPGRIRDQETIVYDNISSGIQFAAVANLVYERARKNGIGVEIPLSWFQQPIRN